VQAADGTIHDRRARTWFLPSTSQFRAALVVTAGLRASHVSGTPIGRSRTVFSVHLSTREQAASIKWLLQNALNPVKTTPMPEMTTPTTDKSLDRFLDVVHNNQLANRARFPDQYGIIQRVDRCFVTAGQHLSYQKPVLVGPLFLRSQYAYKTAAGMTLAGQVAESFVMTRSCLEYAGYALAIFADPRFENTPSREEVFVNRNVDEATLKAHKAEFLVGKIRGMIAAFDEKLAASSFTTGALITVGIRTLMVCLLE
jgi:hypothetical protein